MPINCLRGFTAPERTDAANRRLEGSLAFVARAANARGFLAVGQYTSHMSGIVSSLADNVALGDTDLVVSGLSSLLSFLVGAAASAILINWGRRLHLRSIYATPLAIEAVLLLCFAIVPLVDDIRSERRKRGVDFVSGDGRRRQRKKGPVAQGIRAFSG